MLPVVLELNRRDWRSKEWTTRKNGQRGGKMFNKSRLHKVLTNITYLGKVRYKSEIHNGEHEALIDPATWQKVQTLLSRNGRTGGAIVRNKFGAFLKGLLHCGACACAMTPSHTTRKGNKRYRYYVCVNAQSRGWDNCPSKSIPAGQIERFVVDRIRCIGQDPALMEATIEQASRQANEALVELARERRTLERDLDKWNKEIRRLTSKGADGDTLGHLAELQDRLREGERRLTDVGGQIDALNESVVTDEEVKNALAAFDPIWDSMTMREQARLVELLVEQVTYNGATGKVAITFHPTGIKTLADQMVAGRGTNR